MYGVLIDLLIKLFPWFREWARKLPPDRRQRIRLCLILGIVLLSLATLGIILYVSGTGRTLSTFHWVFIAAACLAESVAAIAILYFDAQGRLIHPATFKAEGRKIVKRKHWDELDALAYVLQVIRRIDRDYIRAIERGQHLVPESCFEESRRGSNPASCPLDREFCRKIKAHLYAKDSPIQNFGFEIDEAEDIEGDEDIDGENPPKYTWIIDGIDGVRHFMRKLPLFTTTVALLDANGKPLIAMILSPVTGELFFAIRGYGAYLNDWKTKLQVSSIESSKAVMHVEFPNRDLFLASEETFQAMRDLLGDILQTVYRVRGLGLGSLGLAYVAKGTFDGYITLPNTTRSSDVIAGMLLVKEAGGQVRCVESNIARPNRVVVVATNGHLPDRFLNVFKGPPCPSSPLAETPTSDS